MKRIGLLTMSCIPNYGALLQTYATYIVFNNTIKNLKYKDISFEVINYEPMLQKKRYSRDALLHSIIYGKGFKDRLYDIHNLFKMRNSETLKLHNISIPFQMRYFNNLNENRNGIDFYDAYVVGSDQTWNPGLMEDDTFLLGFTGAVLKYSYASSIGVEHLNEDDVDRFQRNLKCFRSISLREDIGCEIIRRILPDKTITQVLDPTLLLTKEEWSLIESRQIELCKKYIFVYMAKPSDELLSFARTLGAESGYELKITSTPDTYKNVHDKDYIGMLSPEEFITYLHHAEYVVTNSFHGIAFSINFNKQFYTAYNSATVTKTNSRIESVLRLFDLESRLISRISSKPIDYEKVNMKLEMMREKSNDYIRNILKDVEEHQ